MFKNIYVEKDSLNHPNTETILQRLRNPEITIIDQIDNYWGRVKKPYLQKRDNLNLYIGKKKGELVKEAPDAYGIGSEKHYYFIHAYNCIYECQYCYLQGYFHTPDIVLFVNHDEIMERMQEIIDHDSSGPWFHAGEYSDSLALSHITREWQLYWDFFAKNPNAKLELRTKAVNIKMLEELDPLKNVFISFTMAPDEAAKNFDNKCPPTKHRLNAIEKLVKRGHQIGIHFDPVIFQDNFIDAYQNLISQLSNILPNEQLGYISIGVVRFTKDVYREVQKNYPDSKILAQDFQKSFDGKVRYNRPMRMWMMNNIKEICLAAGYSSEKIYLCMEESTVE